MPADLAVIGLGAYGLPLAQAAVAAGISTIGYRTGPEAGSLSPAELRRMLSGGFRPTTDPAELGRVRTAVICAPTPRGADGGLDLSQLEAAARTLAAHLRPHTTVILESPVYPGATEEFLRPLLPGVDRSRPAVRQHSREEEVRVKREDDEEDSADPLAAAHPANA